MIVLRSTSADTTSLRDDRSGSGLRDRYRRRRCKLPVYLFSQRLTPQCIRAYLYESRVFVSMVLILIFAYVAVGHRLRAALMALTARSWDCTV